MQKKAPCTYCDSPVSSYACEVCEQATCDRCGSTEFKRCNECIQSSEDWDFDCDCPLNLTCDVCGATRDYIDHGEHFGATFVCNECLESEQVRERYES